MGVCIIFVRKKSYLFEVSLAFISIFYAVFSLKFQLVFSMMSSIRQLFRHILLSIPMISYAINPDQSNFCMTPSIAVLTHVLYYREMCVEYVLTKFKAILSSHS
jgi:hypothetical protein